MKFIPVTTRAFLPPRDDIYNLLDQFLPKLTEGDVVVITSKVLAIHQGRCVKIEPSVKKDRLIEREADAYISRRRVPRQAAILTLKGHTLIPSSGIDESNGNGYYVLWPRKVNALLKEIRALYPDLPVIMVSAVTSTSSMAEAIRLGAVDFISKPFDVADVRTIAERSLSCAALQRQMEVDRREAILEYPLHSIVGESTSFRMVMHQARNLATDENCLLILGERGSGSELIARYIHSLSTRNNQPFISLQCSSMPESLAEVELFGKDNFRTLKSGTESLGRLELASSGTLLLKDVHTLPDSIQKKLIRVLREKTFSRMNDSHRIKTDARIIFTSFRDLKQEPPSINVNKELLQTLMQHVIEIPPLRERTEDVALLAYCFLNYFKQRINAPMSDIDSRAMGFLRKYSWPGNVKELRNVIERAVVIHGDKKCLLPDFLPHEIQNGVAALALRPNLRGTLEETVNAFQREIITQALLQTKGRHSRAAKLLGTTARILNYRIKQLNIRTMVQ